MKLALVFAAAAGVAGLIGASIGLRELPVESGKGAQAPANGAPADSVVTDGVEVFRRAFWRHPAPDDRIVHAERREWLDQGDVSRWSWFIEVEPSAGLTAHLVEGNAFGLSATNEFAGSGPEWFPTSAEGFRILGSEGARMVLLVNEERIFATGSGAGFRAAAEVPSQPRAEPVAEIGRLPDQSPPDP
ncbi:hypothetical protein HAHE_13080 [Haloferula helveola]|uniref:Uncharacterized protein n=1 Tax=Haloferula helveola TaxID=490095 RepID=A0ABM7RCF8_9BACT|nr:hypothetical protein HAHE_13080 [Haloferula helveola]